MTLQDGDGDGSGVPDLGGEEGELIVTYPVGTAPGRALQINLFPVSS
jgi:hypothetical protein